MRPPRSPQENRGPARRKHNLLLVAKNVAINFANTVVDPDGEPAGTLRSWEDLLLFLDATGSATPSALEGYRSAAVRHPRDCAATFLFALKLRDAVRTILETLASGGIPQLKEVEILNSVLMTGAGYERLVRSHGKWQLTHVREANGTVSVLLPVANAAAEIVTQGTAAGIRKCANPECILYFEDPNGRRRWCSMKICGNRAKVAAHWRRHH